MELYFLLSFLLYPFYIFYILFFKNKEKVNDTADSTTAIRKIILKDLGEGKTPTVVPSIDIWTHLVSS
jgi:hypothetical protein